MATSLKIKSMPQVEVLNRDLTLEIIIDGDKAGELRMSKGSVDFYEKGAKKAHYRVGWKKLCELLKNNGEERG